MISSIPPNTAFKQTKPTKKLKDCQRYSAPKKYVPTIKPNETFSVEEVSLDLFEEDGFLKIIGDFHGIDKKDISVNIVGDALVVISSHSLSKRYEASVKLPKNFRTTLKSMEVKFENVPIELQALFDECLKRFPELKNIDLKLVKSDRKHDTIEGAKGKVGEKDVVVLFIPNDQFGKWDLFKPVIFHELSHFIDLENPDRIFYERADEKSIRLWDFLKDGGNLECKVGE